MPPTLDTLSHFAHSLVSLELLRQEKSIISVSAKAKHYHSPDFAEKQFRSESVQTRSRFDREVGTSSSSVKFDYVLHIVSDTFPMPDISE